jgi:protease-4
LKTKPLVVFLIIGLALIAVLATLGPGQGARVTSTAGPVIALVRIDGTLVTGLGQGASLFETTSGSDSIVATLGRIKNDPAVRAVVLRVNSPGGTPAASQEIVEAITEVRAAGKIVVTSMADVAASGAYWIAASTDHIVADPGTITGSIGVIWQFANYEELYRKLGIDHVTFTSGPYKDMGSVTRDLSPQEEEIVRSIIDEMYNQFVDAVASGRRMAREDVLALADGRIFIGTQALEAGLIDSLGGLRPAVAKAAELAGVGDRYRVEEYGRRSPWQILLGEVGSLVRGLRAVWLPGGTIIGP